MKKILFLVVAVLGANFANAQKEQLRSTGQPAVQADTATSVYQRKGYIRLRNADIPGTLRTTLMGTEYMGWENNGTVYRNPTTDEYVLELRPGKRAGGKNNTTIHRFDQMGQPLPKSSDDQ